MYPNISPSQKLAIGVPLGVLVAAIVTGTYLASGKLWQAGAAFVAGLILTDKILSRLDRTLSQQGPADGPPNDGAA